MDDTERRIEEIPDSDLMMARVLDRMIGNKLPDGTQALTKIEGSALYQIHKLIHLSFNPNAIAVSEEFTGYLWANSRTVTLEPVGGVTIGISDSGDKVNIGRALFKTAEDEYRIVHRMFKESIK